MVTALGLADLIPLAEKQGQYSDDERKIIVDALERAFRTRTATDWEDTLGNVSVPAGKIHNLGDILKHPQTAASGCLDDLHLPGLDAPLKLPGLGFTSDSWERTPLAHPETAGKSTQNVMRTLGYSDEDIAALMLADVIEGPVA